MTTTTMMRITNECETGRVSYCGFPSAGALERRLDRLVIKRSQQSAFGEYDCAMITSATQQS